MYWATLTRSFEVLSVLCEHAKCSGCSLDVSIPDFTNSSPLDVAVASQQWDMVQLLVQNGGLKVCFLHITAAITRFFLTTYTCVSQDNVRLQSAVENLAQLAPDVDAKRDGGNRSWGGVSTALSGLLGCWKASPPLRSKIPSSSSMGVFSFARHHPMCV